MLSVGNASNEGFFVGPVEIQRFLFAEVKGSEKVKGKILFKSLQSPKKRWEGKSCCFYNRLRVLQGKFQWLFRLMRWPKASSRGLISSKKACVLAEGFGTRFFYCFSSILRSSR